MLCKQTLFGDTLVWLPWIIAEYVTLHSMAFYVSFLSSEPRLLPKHAQHSLDHFGDSSDNNGVFGDCRCIHICPNWVTRQAPFGLRRTYIP